MMLLSEGQMNDHKAFRLVFDALPAARSLIADRSYDSVWLRDALPAKASPPASLQPGAASGPSPTARTSIDNGTGRSRGSLNHRIAFSGSATCGKQTIAFADCGLNLIHPGQVPCVGAAGS